MQNDYQNIWEAPIHTQVGEMKCMMANKFEQQVVKVVQEVGIEIDPKSLVEAINNDRRRYEEAYKRGFEDGRAKGLQDADRRMNELQNVIDKISNILINMKLKEEQGETEETENGPA